MITPEVKDKVLSYIVNNGMRYFISANEDSAKYEVHPRELLAILDQFEDNGFIYIVSRTLGGVYEFNVRAAAHDFYLHGGFVGQEMILKGNIEKLGLEIDKLAKDLSEKQLDTANKITSLGGSILAALGLMS